MEFKLFGYDAVKREDDDIISLSMTSLCFLNVKEMKRFADFMQTCVKGVENNADWDHEDYLDGSGSKQIVISLWEE